MPAHAARPCTAHATSYPSPPMRRSVPAHAVPLLVDRLLTSDQEGAEEEAAKTASASASTSRRQQRAGRQQQAKPKQHPAAAAGHASLPGGGPCTEVVVALQALELHLRALSVAGEASSLFPTDSSTGLPLRGSLAPLTRLGGLTSLCVTKPPAARLDMGSSLRR